MGWTVKKVFPILERHFFNVQGSLSPIPKRRLVDEKEAVRLPTFMMDFHPHGIEAFQVDGHTPGFNCYIFEETLFVCDYVFLDSDRMKFNPFGPLERTIAGGRRIREHLEGRRIAQVCGYNNVIEFSDWLRRFDKGPAFEGF
jgi:hydroxyacylglutathione hydrolase